MGRVPHLTASHLAGGLLALILSVCLGMYMLYDPSGVRRGAGAPVIAGLDLSTR